MVIKKLYKYFHIRQILSFCRSIKLKLFCSCTVMFITTSCSYIVLLTLHSVINHWWLYYNDNMHASHTKSSSGLLRRVRKTLKLLPKMRCHFCAWCLSIFREIIKSHSFSHTHIVTQPSAQKLPSHVECIRSLGYRTDVDTNKPHVFESIIWINIWQSWFYSWECRCFCRSSLWFVPVEADVRKTNLQLDHQTIENTWVCVCCVLCGCVCVCI